MSGFMPPPGGVGPVVNVTELLSIAGALAIADPVTIDPFAPPGDQQNDWDIAVLNPFATIFLVAPANSPTLVTGLEAPTINRVCIFINTTPANALRFTFNSGASSPGNRFLNPSGDNMILGPNGAAGYWYDLVTQAWRIIFTTASPS